MKSVPFSENVEESEIENQLEKMINLRNPSIAVPIGFLVPIEPGSWKDSKIVRLYLEGYS
jgi:hypothetical protein